MSSVLDTRSPGVRDTHFMWLEITGNCQHECGHCYAGSGPGKGHGPLSTEQWMQTLTEAAAAGVEQVQFIGGEPTTHPALPALIAHGVQLGLRIEVFSNLFMIRDQVWEAMMQPGVTLATSYYSATPQIHDRITLRSGSYARTSENIVEAVRRGIPIRVGLTRFSDDQDIDAAVSELVAFGVDPDAIRIDDERGVGRGRSSSACSPENELCGKCASGVLAVMPDGTVQPCVFSRDASFEVGNVIDDGLASVINGDRLSQMRDDLTAVFMERGLIGFDSGAHACAPACSPSCIPTGTCNPVVNPPPCNPIAGHPPAPEPPTRPPGPVCSPY